MRGFNFIEDNSDFILSKFKANDLIFKCRTIHPLLHEHFQTKDMHNHCSLQEVLQSNYDGKLFDYPYLKINHLGRKGLNLFWAYCQRFQNVEN